MKIIVIGAGNVGSTLARSLSTEEHDVIVIENDPEIASKIESEQDVSVIRGNGSRPAVLESAGIKDGTDILIACTNRDDTNLMACWLAKREGVKRVMARVKDLEFTDTPNWAADLGIDVMASPERSLSREIASLLTFNAAVHSSELFNGRAGSFAFRVEDDSPINGMSLKDLGTKYPTLGAIIVYIERGEEGFVPSGDWTAQEGDLCFIVTMNERVPAVQRLFVTERQKKLSRVIIIGGGKLGRNLAQRLAANATRIETVLVEKNMTKCQRLAQELPDVKIINGDGTDRDLMMQLGVDHANGVVAATSNDELNVVIAALANVQEGVKTIAVVRSPIYDDLESRLPVDVLVNPNTTLASTFLRYVRYPNTAVLLSLIDRIGAEMFEIKLAKGHPAVGRKIMELGLPKGILIAIITRGKTHLVPGGSEVLHEGDVLSVFAMADMMTAAMRIFRLDES